jgi:murein DD-endopeptidase MepM/ murein hydrolase activator NlpD
LPATNLSSIGRLGLLALLVAGMLVAIAPIAIAHVDPQAHFERVMRNRAQIVDRLDVLERRIKRTGARSKWVARELRKSRPLIRSVESRFFIELSREHFVLRDNRASLKRQASKARRRIATLDVQAFALREQLSHLFQVCPVDSPRSFVDDFGVVSRRGVPHVHQGVDVHAWYGTPIRAPFSGTAVDATNEIGGLAVKVFGAGGFVYNAHLSAFGRLGPVRAGTIVGYVGTSGNAFGTMPHDHLEWHPGGGSAVNPFPYLVESCL